LATSVERSAGHNASSPIAPGSRSRWSRRLKTDGWPTSPLPRWQRFSRRWAVSWSSMQLGHSSPIENGSAMPDTSDVW